MALRWLVACCGGLWLWLGGGAAEAQVGACAEDDSPDVLLVFDKSGSMRNDGRWDQAKAATDRLLRDFEQRMRFGLLLFPSGGDGCAVARAPQVGCGLGNRRAIDGVLDGNQPGGSTPLGRAISQGRAYLESIALRGRRSAIIAISDGGESCGANVVSIAEAAFEEAGIPVFVIAFGNALNADERATLDRIARAGGTDRALPAGDGDALLRALEDIAADLEREICNGIDDDCDGTVDEDVPGEDEVCETGRPGRCGPGLSLCAGGALICVGDLDPIDELCNGVDDDCDGALDEGRPESDTPCVVRGAEGPCAFGMTLCANGALSCVPDHEAVDEACNLFDDDCDGQVDEGPLPGEGGACETGEPGVCDVGGWLCLDGMFECVPARTPTDETCDGLDEDCDGALDEGVVAAFDEAVCFTGQPGRCALGDRVCQLGAWGCAEREGAVAEVCDGVDDDCDGRVDEGLRNACGRCGEAPGEACDGFDEDCDGRVDEEAPCPPAQVCFAGACVDACPPSRECQGGRVCHEDLCVDPCAITDCPGGQRCEQGACLDPCADVACGADEHCRDGRCVATDCHASGCGSDEMCREGVCVPHPCAGVECAAGQACRGGGCVPSCAAVACSGAQRCVDGACVDDPCAEVRCAAGEVCRDGACTGDACLDAACAPGQRCHDGFCIEHPCQSTRCPMGERCEAEGDRARCVPDWFDEDPCAGLECPAGEVCRLLDGRRGCVPGEPEPEPEPAMEPEPLEPQRPDDLPVIDAGPPPGAAEGARAEAEAVGCACDAAGDRVPGPWLALLLLGGLVRRRRARG